MPRVEVLNPKPVYNKLIKNVRFNDIPGLKNGKANYRNLKSRVEGYLSSRTAAQQLEMDVALWYGFLNKRMRTGETDWKKGVCLRLFCLLAHGGLMVHRERGWIPWCNVGPAGSKGAPICSAISHTARVLIWLPPDEQEAFFNWLFGDPDLMATQTRWAATHGVEECRIADVVAGISKGVKENKSKSGAKHYGVNIALGGYGNINPISGKGIRDNGKHGHLYIAVANELYHGRLGVLVATEQSAPIDRQEAVKGKAGRLKSLFRTKKIVDVPDQYGGGHALGGHSRFSSTGGDDFTYKDNPTNLGDYGPSRGNYLDGMYVDLASSRFEYVRNKEFTIDMIGKKGFPPIPPTRAPRVPPRPRRSSF